MLSVWLPLSWGFVAMAGRSPRGLKASCVLDKWSTARMTLTSSVSNAMRCFARNRRFGALAFVLRGVGSASFQLHMGRLAFRMVSHHRL